MKTSIHAAAVRCAKVGRNAVRFGKLGMGRLVRMSDLSLLQRPVYCSIASDKPLAMGSGKQPISSRMSVMAMPTQEDWRPRGDSRMVSNQIALNAMPHQETLTLKASATA